MNPTPDEIAFVLAAPEAVREALRGFALGWAVAPDGSTCLYEGGPPESDEPFLPCDPTAIVEAAARIAPGASPYEAGVEFWGEPIPSWEAWLVTGPQHDPAYRGPSVRNNAVAPTARLAALHLLAAVVAP